MVEIIVLILTIKFFTRLTKWMQYKAAIKQAAEERAIAKADAAEAKRRKEVEKARKAEHEKETAAERMEFYLAQLDRLKETAYKLDAEIENASPKRKEKLEKQRFALDGQMFRTQEKVNESYYKLDN